MGQSHLQVWSGSGALPDLSDGSKAASIVVDHLSSPAGCPLIVKNLQIFTVWGQPASSSLEV